MEIKFSNKGIVTFIGVIFVIILGFIDLQIGYMISFSLFYVIPILFVTWYGGKKIGILISICSSFAWFITETLPNPNYVHFLIPYWNAGIRLGFFLIISILFSKLHDLLKNEAILARKDFLTNTWNRLAFYELAKIEKARAERHQLLITLVYIDLDNFKLINDRFGHQVGDELLILVVNTINDMIRKSDILARLGGDEFALLLPETNSDDSVNLVHRIRKELLEAMLKREWPVTFSIGIVTFLKFHYSLDEMLDVTDELMYSVKKNHKNSIIHRVYN